MTAAPFVRLSLAEITTQVISSFIVITSVLAIAYSQALTGQFIALTQLGKNSTGTTTPHCIAVTKEDTLLVSGTSHPFTRLSESDLGIPLESGLRNDDIFFAKVEGASTPNPRTSVFRLGTNQEDHLFAMLVQQGGNITFLAGETHGAFQNSSNRGLSDAFVIKLITGGEKPEYAWRQAIHLGTVDSERITSLAADPANDSVIYATGYTSGSLFAQASDNKSVLFDAIIFAFSSEDGTILYKRQFGTVFSDFGTAVVISDEKDGPIWVSVITEPKYGNYAVGNFHLYKFSRSLSPLGDLLLRTYSREDIAAFAKHPFLKKSLLVAGSSFRDEITGKDVLVKRVIRAFDNKNIGASEIAIGDVGADEYTYRLGSGDAKLDEARDMLVHPVSGRMLVGGYTSGSLQDSVLNTGDAAPFIICLNPINAVVTAISQMQVTRMNALIKLQAMTLSQSGDVLYYAMTDERLGTLGKFVLPEEWKVRIQIPPTPSPSPSPVSPSVSNVTTSVPSGVSFRALIYSFLGVLACVLLLIVVVLIWRRRVRQKEAVTGLTRRRVPRPTEEGIPPARIVPRGERDEVKSSGLV